MDIIFVLKHSYQNLIVDNLKNITYVNLDGSISIKTKDELHATSFLEEIKPHSVIKIKSSGFLGDAECMLRTDDIDSVLIHEKKKLFNDI